MFVFLNRFKFSLLLAVVIVVLSLLPSNSLPDSGLFSIRFLDKLAHLGMFGMLGMVALLELRCRERCAIGQVIVLMMIFLMGLAIELIQATLIDSRTAEWLDLMANGFGLLAGYLANRVLLGIRS
jgi:VanZ family protein